MPALQPVISRKPEPGETKETVTQMKARGYTFPSYVPGTHIPTAYAADTPTPPGTVIYVK